MASDFFSYLYQKMRLLFILWSIWNYNPCFGIFELENFEACGIFLQHFYSNASEQVDITHEILEHLQENPKRLLSVIIKNGLSQREIQQDIFRSMNYDCYLNVHVNFGNDMFSTVPSLEDPVRSFFYKKGLFLMFVTRNPMEMFTLESRKLQLDVQYRIFVFRIAMTRNFYHNSKKQLMFYKPYFFCSFCLSGLIRLNPRSSNILSVKMSDFKKSWVPEFAEHYFQVYDETFLTNQTFCRKQNAM